MTKHWEFSSKFIEVNIILRLCPVIRDPIDLEDSEERNNSFS